MLSATSRAASSRRDRFRDSLDLSKESSNKFCAMAGSGVAACVFFVRFLLLLVETSEILLLEVRLTPRARVSSSTSLAS